MTTSSKKDVSAMLFFTKLRSLSFYFGCLLTQAALGQSALLKNLVQIEGVRPNVLIGYGIVLGLQASGDSAASSATRQAVATMLGQLGTEVTADQLVGANFASVVATAELPPFARSGDKIDVRISAVGDAKSLAGGTLILTHLRAGDGLTYAVAQGAVVMGQSGGRGGITTVANVPAGALIERDYVPSLAKGNKLSLSLKNADFTTNARVVRKINEHFRGFYASSRDAANIDIVIPPPFSDDAVSFISAMEQLEVEFDQKAIVVLNERTGTIVMGSSLRLSPITIAHGDLSIRVEDPKTKQSKDDSLLSIGGTTVGEVVNSLNSFGVKPKDLVAILQALHAAGALQGELKFI